MTNYLTEILLIALTVFFNLLFESLAMKFYILISISKTIICISFIFFKSFFRISSKLII